MNVTKRNDRTADRTPTHTREPRTVEELLAREQARARAGLKRSLDELGHELADALERSPAGRHPLLTGGAALVLGLTCGPTLLRGVGGTLRLSTSALRLALPLVLGLPRLRLSWFP